MSDQDPFELKACRACLATEVKLFNLCKLNLADNFSDLTKTPVFSADRLPQSVCYVCRAQLLKCIDFQKKCQNAYFYLQEICAHQHRVTTEHIQSMDKIKFPMPLSMSKTKLEYILPEGITEDDLKNLQEDSLKHLENSTKDYDDLIHFEGEEEDKKNHTEKSIEFDNFNDTNHKTDFAIEVNIKSEIFDDIDILAEPFTEFKNEEELEHFFKPKKSRLKKKLKDKPKDKTKKKKKCNKYNEKFEEDFEEFSKLHNVKVVCLSREEQIRRIQEKKDSKEYKESRFSCDVCYKGFMSETAYKRHVKAHDPSSGSFVCEVCHMRYPTQHNLSRHARAHKKIFVCTLCDQVNVNTARAKLHSSWHKGIKFECKICQKLFNANTTYLSHVRERHKPAACEQCGDTFCGTQLLQAHRNTHHKQNECDTCAVVFQTAAALQRHRSGGECNGNTLLRPCVLCGENFTCRVELSEHMKQTHRGNGETFTCEECNSVFTSDRSLGIHFANAHYTLKRRLNKHKHVEQKAYLCEWCAKSFPTALRLKLHQSLHSDERRYQCALCHKRLKTKAGLEFHVNSHTGRRPYKCRACELSFKSHAHRYNHHLMKHTTREKSHKCASCDKCFVTSSDLKKHVRYVHLRQPRPHANKKRINKQNV